MNARASFAVILAAAALMLLVACVRVGLPGPGEPVPDCSESQTCVIETPCMMFGPDGTSTCCPGPVAKCDIGTPKPTETPCDPASACPTFPKPCPPGVLSDCPPCLYLESGESFLCPPPCLSTEMPCIVTPEPTPTPCDLSLDCPTPPKPCPLGVLTDCPPCLYVESGESFACPPPCPPDDTMPCYITPVPCDSTTCPDPCLYIDGSTGDGPTGVACATPCLMVGPGVISTCCPGPAAECFVTPFPTPAPCDPTVEACPPCLAIEAPYIDGCPPPCSPNLEMPCILLPAKP